MTPILFPILFGTQIYFARQDSKGKLLPPGEIKTPGRSGMHTAMLALSAPDRSTLVAWKKDEALSRRSGSLD